MAVRTGTVVNFLVGDHLGSTSVVTDASGAVAAEMKYKPFGEVRADSGMNQTGYTFTGQYSQVDDFGLMFYNARWVDPLLSHFASADTLIPDPDNPLAWNRYAYTLYNPIRYTDPSGHVVSDKSYGDVDDKAYKKWLRETYNWELKGNNWTTRQVIRILNDAIDIKNAADRITHGNGKEWMRGNFPSLTFILDDLQQDIISFLNHRTPTSFVSPNATIHLVEGFENFDPKLHHVPHEVFHTLDNRSGNKNFPATIFGGGYGDRLAKFVGGDPSGMRFMNGTSGIPTNMQWEMDVNRGYGNHSTADYLAEAYVWTFFNPSFCPDKLVENWIIGRVLITTP